MIQLQRILLPTDFSKHSAEAMKYACAFAEQFDAELHFLHVLETHPSSTPDFGMGLALRKAVKESKQAAAHMLDGLLDSQWTESQHVVRATADGAPFLEIIKYAREHDIDLIVMGTHGHSGLAHVIMGSVAERVVRKAPCPVLTVRLEGHRFVMP